LKTSGRAGGVAQVVEHLLCKDKALSSNSRPTKKKERNTGNQRTITEMMKTFGGLTERLKW
jgi:hypothetical protein